MKETKASVKQIKRFIAELSKLAPEEFLGLANVLCIQLFNEAKEPKNSEDLLTEIVLKFAGLGKSQRKQIMSLLKATNLGGGDNVGSSSDTKAEK